MDWSKIFKSPEERATYATERAERPLYKRIGEPELIFAIFAGVGEFEHLLLQESPGAAQLGLVGLAAVAVGGVIIKNRKERHEP